MFTLLIFPLRFFFERFRRRRGFGGAPA